MPQGEGVVAGFRRRGGCGVQEKGWLRGFIGRSSASLALAPRRSEGQDRARAGDGSADSFVMPGLQISTQPNTLH